MKVALELQPCCGNRTGIGNYTYELARRMVSDQSITYQGNVFNFLGKIKTESSLSEIDMAIRENRLFSYGIYRRIWNIIPIRYKWMFPPADVTHFFNYIVPPKITGKVITTIHDMTYIRYPETVSAANLRRIRNGILYSIERSQLIVTSSEFSKTEIEDLLNIPSERIIVIPAAASVIPLMSVAKKNYSEPYILYLGAIEPRKNIVRLLHAFELLKREANIPHKLILAGGRGWNCDNIYKTAESIFCNNDVIFRGYVTEAEKAALYTNATAFVFPSLYEGFGIPLLEAMTFGTPVVCSNTSSLPEVAGDAACYVDPLSVEEIAEGLWQVISRPEFAAKLSACGLERAGCFSWDKSANILKSVYSSFLN